MIDLFQYFLRLLILPPAHELLVGKLFIKKVGNVFNAVKFQEIYITKYVASDDVGL